MGGDIEETRIHQMGQIDIYILSVDMFQGDCVSVVKQ